MSTVKRMPNLEAKLTVDTSEAKKELSELEQAIDRIVRKMNSMASLKRVKQIDEMTKMFKDSDSMMNFGQAIEAMKQGKRVARTGWNGKEQYIELATSISYVNTKSETINALHKAIGNNAIAFVGTSGVQLGWLASQADILAEDWIIFE